MSILTPSQREQLVTLAESQVDSINQYAYDRFELMDAFRRLLEGDLPAGSTGLDLEAVKAYSAELYRLDGQISFERAETMGGILRSMDASQLAYLDAMVGQGMLDWPDVPDQLDPRTSAARRARGRDDVCRRPVQLVRRLGRCGRVFLSRAAGHVLRLVLPEGCAGHAGSVATSSTPT